MIPNMSPNFNIGSGVTPKYNLGPFKNSSGSYTYIYLGGWNG
jgi:hypothetical protein